MASPFSFPGIEAPRYPYQDVIAIFAPGQNKEADALFGYVKQRRWDDIHDVQAITTA